MLFFPQLSSGAIAQFPYSRQRIFRTVSNETVASATIKSTDVSARRTRWALTLHGLTDAERQAMETFVDAAGGTLHTFTYLDPLDNLLPMSESYQDSAWHKDAGLVLTTSQADPLTTARATRVTNPTSIGQRLYQLLPLTCSFKFTASVYLRSISAAPPTLLIGPASNPSSVAQSLASEWRRYSFAYAGGSQEEELVVGCELPPACEVDIFGFQLEPANSATEYKATNTSAGIYGSCRLADDEFQWTTEGLNNHSIGISIVTS